jgi:predicted glycoside hydrolase/deacetylase ChbG (UPF0249 family)
MPAGLSVIVPAYDEGDHIASSLERLRACLEAGGRPFEILVVDDGSRDDTAAAAGAIAAADARVRVLRHERNRGKGRALASGVAAAREEILVLLDADLEIPPEDVLPLVRRMEAAGADVAVGSKYHPGATLEWPPARRALSRAYHLVTAVLFRLPLRDTQTGLKAVRRGLARAIVPRLRARRFAWDLELLLLAHRAGARFVTGPVHVRPAARASRVGAGGALQAGIDTLRIWWRDRALAGYAEPRRRPRPTRVLVSGDDLGLSAEVDEGLIRGLEIGGLTAVSVLAEGATTVAALRGLARRAPGADVGVHLDLLRGASPWALASAALWGRLDRAAVARIVTSQVDGLRGAGVAPTHLDAHRHAWCLPRIHRRVLHEAARAQVGAVRSLRPLGPLRSAGWIEAAKRLVLLAFSVASAGAGRGRGRVAPDRFGGAAEAARWVREGRLPAYARGRTVEVIAHPASGDARVPAGEAGTLDRRAQARYVSDPPLAAALASLGALVTDFGRWTREERHGHR